MSKSFHSSFVKDEHQGSKFLRHVECENCGSSDANSVYSDGHQYCFSCLTYVRDQSKTNVEPESYIPAKANGKDKDPSFGEAEYVDIKDRKISLETSRKYGIKCVTLSTGEIYKHYYPYKNSKGELIGTKTRVCAKKEFPIDHQGKWSQATLFGSHLFNAGGKAITITEGELDAAAVYQMNGGFPAVSIPNGAKSAFKDCKKNLEYLDSFESVVLCLDSHKDGKAASSKVAELFPPGKCYILELELKDPCEYLKTNQSKKFTNEWWNKKKLYTPDGIICLSDMWKTLSTKDETISVDYPWSGLQDLTYGMRLGELCTYAAGTGQGKSTTVREITYHVLQSTPFNVGMLFLEESVKRTALALLGIHANKPFHIPTCEYTDEEFKGAFDALSLDRRVFLFDHFGSWDIEKLVSRVRYMAKGLDCKFIFLDHISIVVSVGDHYDERRALDEIMTKLRMLVQELDIHLGVVTHLKRISTNGGHEEGSAVSLSHLRGSAGIAQLSDMVFGLERDSQNDDPLVRNTTLIRVLKNRFSGDTGPATFLSYDRATGRQKEIDELPSAGDNNDNDSGSDADVEELASFVNIDEVG